VYGPIRLADDREMHGVIRLEGGIGNDTFEVYMLDGPGGDDYLGRLEIDGGDGDDEILIDNSVGVPALDAGAARYTLAGSSDVNFFRSGGRPSGQFKTAERIVLKTSGHKDVVRLENDLAVFRNGVVIESNDGDDEVYIDGVGGSLRLGLAAGQGEDSLFVQSGHVNDPDQSGFDKRLEITGGTLTLNGMNNMFVLDVNQTGGYLAGTATVRAERTLSWTGGTMQDDGITEALTGSTVTITGPVTLNSRLFHTAGSATWSKDIAGNGNGELKNTGTLRSSGRDVTLAGHLTNIGVLWPGQAATIGRITVTRQYTDSGLLAVDVGPEGDESDQVVADTVALSGTLIPVSTGGFPAKFYTVVKNLSMLPAGQFGNAPQGHIFTIDNVRYKMLYEADPANWGKAVLRAVQDLGLRAWEDKSLDGVRDPAYDGPVSGVGVALYRAADGALIETTSTGNNGEYRFVDVVSDDYYLLFTAPDADWRLTVHDAASDALDSDPDRATGKTAVFTLGHLAPDLTRDAGLYRLGGIGGWIWTDMGDMYGGVHADGIQNEDQYTYYGAGTPVSLYDAAGTLVQSTVAGSTGGYSFSGVELRDASWTPITYRVKFLCPTTGSGVYISPKDAGGNDEVDSDADPATGYTDFYTLTQSGEFKSMVDMGVYSKDIIMRPGGGGGKKPDEGVAIAGGPPPAFGDDSAPDRTAFSSAVSPQPQPTNTQGRQPNPPPRHERARRDMNWFEHVGPMMAIHCVVTAGRVQGATGGYLPESHPGLWTDLDPIWIG
jgi:hypothetical protein